MDYAIFAVNDARPVRLAVERLKEFGLAVQVFSQGESALNAIQGRAVPPGLVFADALLPRLDGFELTANVASLFPGAECRMILATVPSAYGPPLYSWSSGAVANFLMTPYDPWQVVFAVEQLVCRRIVHNEAATRDWYARFHEASGGNEWYATFADSPEGEAWLRWYRKLFRPR